MENTPMRSARKKRGLSLDDLAEKVGASKGHLSNVERGHGCSPDLAEKLAAELGISEMEILYPQRFSKTNE